MKIYADTSFLASLYTPDANSADAARRMRAEPHATVLISDLAELELVNALQQRLFRKELGAAQIRLAQKAFREDSEQGIFQRRPVETGAVYERALRLARKWTSTLGTRTLDLLHIALALEMGSDGIYTFDQQQSKLARAEGLKLY